MNQQLQQAFQQLLNMLTSGAQAASQQVPDILHQEIVYGRATETIILLIFMGLFACGVGAVLLLLRNYDEWSSGFQDAAEAKCVAASVVGIGGIVIGAIGTLLQWSIVVQVWFAPKLYLIYWLKGLLNQ